MKTKIITSYYAYHFGEPFWGHKNRERWYMYSLISLCNMGETIICYTDENDKGYNQLQIIKEKHKLDNLTIKIFKLSDNPWQEKIYKIRMLEKNSYLNNPLDWRYECSSQIYWLKWYFMKEEFEPNINLYWIDCGLSHGGLFPKSTNPYADSENYMKHFPDENGVDVEFRYYQFTRAFNPEFVKKVNNWHDGKIINLYNNTSTNQNFGNFLRFLNLENTLSQTSVIIFPVAGFWGGNSNLIPKYTSEYFKMIDKILELDNYIVADEEIMTYVNTMHSDMFKNWEFTTFSHEDSGSFNLNTDKSFSFFFRKELE